MRRLCLAILLLLTASIAHGGGTFVREECVGPGTFVKCSTPAAAYPPDISEYDARLTAVFDDNSQARPSWATEPTTTTDVTISTNDCATLQDEVDGTNGSGRHIELTAAVTACSLTFSGTDIWLEMTGSGSVANAGGAHTFAGGTRIKVTGGALTWANGSGDIVYFNSTTDVLIDNVNLTGYATQTTATTPHTRLTIMNSNFVTEGQCYLHTTDGAIDGTPSSFDTIFYKNDFDCSNSGNSSQYGLRMQELGRALVAGNRIENNSTGSNLRYHEDTQYALGVDNWLMAIGGNSTQGHLMYTSSGATLTWVHNADSVYIADDSRLWNSFSAAYITTGSGGTCNNLLITDNEVYASSSSTMVFYNAGNDSCSTIGAGTSNGNVAFNYTGSIYDGAIPTCSTIGCGSDH